MVGSAHPTKHKISPIVVYYYMVAEHTLQLYLGVLGFAIAQLQSLSP